MAVTSISISLLALASDYYLYQWQYFCRIIYEIYYFLSLVDPI
jgi:hypothetical protein